MPPGIAVSRLTGGAIADDGSSLDILVQSETGETLTLTLAFEHFTWLLQSLLELSNELYERQVAHGILRDVPHTGAMDAEGFQVLIEPRGATAIVQITGRRTPDAPPGLGAFRVGKAEFLRALADQCNQAASEIEQRSRPA